MANEDLASTATGFWDRWLLFVAWLLVVFGLLLAFFNQTRLFDVAFNRQIDPVFWPEMVLADSINLFQSWIYGVLGATVAGWGMFIVFLARHPFPRRERWARDCIAAGFIVWYIADTSISLYFGVLFNALFNTLLAGLVFAPLLATKKEFRGHS
jgi:hypothetical protein